MKASVFKAGGGLTEEQAHIYITRRADSDALSSIRAMDYVLLIEPRQQGKTSLINYLIRSSVLAGIRLAYVDVTTLGQSDEMSWYATLSNRILRQLGSSLSPNRALATPTSSASWRDFLWELAALATEARTQLVIAFDEIGAVAVSGATQFFSVLRDVYNSRQAETEFKRLTFLLSGAFHPRDLIKNDKVSPFNIAHRVRLEDFTSTQVEGLIRKGPWLPEQITALAERIYYWTDGQPYLTQLLCSYLEIGGTPTDIDAGVERLRREDENHLAPILEQLHRDDKLREYVNDVHAGKLIRFYPREHRRQAQLELLGVLKADEEGYCSIRNRMYELALYSHDNPTSTFRLPVAETTSSVTVPRSIHQQPTPLLGSEQGWVTFKLQLARQADLQFEMRALATPMGQPHATGRLPFDATNLIAALKVLEHNGYDPADFSPVQTEALQRLGLVRDNQLVSDHLKRIGQGLYEALFPGDVGVAFRLALSQARQARQTVFLQLRLNSDAVDLARYPWELLHDGQRHLVSAGAVEFTRYITYSEAAPSLPVEPPARLLFVESRPKDLGTLPPDSERLAVWNALQALTGNGKLTLHRLETPTYDALLERMASADYHLIHFDGHGIFARRCPRCQSMNYPHLTTCYGCQSPLDVVSPQGYLAFEDGAGKADFVSTEDMENLLLNSQVRLMFLSACQTGIVRGDSLFAGLGPGLIRAGVPAVVAMQFSVPMSATISFAESFYTALARGETVSRAVAQGRRRLFRGSTWFIPTLYLRSQDDEGHIIAA